MLATNEGRVVGKEGDVPPMFVSEFTGTTVVNESTRSRPAKERATASARRTFGDQSRTLLPRVLGCRTSLSFGEEHAPTFERVGEFLDIEQVEPVRLEHVHERR